MRLPRRRTIRGRRALTAALVASALLVTGCTGGGESEPPPRGGPRGELPQKWADAATADTGDNADPIEIDLTVEPECALGWTPSVNSTKTELRSASTGEQNGAEVHRCDFAGPTSITAGVVKYPDDDELTRTYGGMLDDGASEHARGKQTVALLRRAYPNKRVEYLLMVADPKKRLSFDVEIERPDAGFTAKDAVDVVMTAFE